MAHDVFISHSTKDKSAADATCAALEARGIRCWVAPRDILPGETWPAAIVRGIRGTRIFVLVFSHEANVSKPVQNEVAQAADLRKHIICFGIEKVAPDEIEDDLKFFLATQHWLETLTEPFAERLDHLADVCAEVLAMDEDDGVAARVPSLGRVGARRDESWWRRQRRSVKVGLIAAVVAAVAATGGITAHLLRPTARSIATSNSAAGPPITTTAANPAEVNNARAQIVKLTGAWSDQGFHEAINTRDINVVGMYLKSGKSAKTLIDGVGAILYGFQGMAQNGDPIELIKTFQAAGFKVDDELEDSALMAKLTDDGHRSWLPMPFKGPLAPKGYAGGNGGTFVGSMLFWVVQRSTWLGTDEDNQVMKYLIDQGADCKVPLAFLDYQKMVDTPQHQLMKSCAK